MVFYSRHMGGGGGRGRPDHLPLYAFVLFALRNDGDKLSLLHCTSKLSASNTEASSVLPPMSSASHSVF